MGAARCCYQEALRLEKTRTAMSLSDPFPTTKKITVSSGKILDSGLQPTGYAVEDWKEHDSTFKDAHDILQTFLWQPPKFDYTWSVKFVTDTDLSIYPEVYQAWRDQGGDENWQT